MVLGRAGVDALLVLASLACSQHTWVILIKWLQVNVTYPNTTEGYGEHHLTVAAYGVVGWVLAVAYVVRVGASSERRFYMGALDYAPIAVLSLVFHGAFLYAVSKTTILAVLLSIQLDAVYLLAVNVFTGMSTLSVASALGVPLVVGGFVVVTTLKWCASEGWCAEWTNTLTSDVQGLFALFGARLAFVLRGSLTHILVVRRHAVAGDGEEDVVRRIEEQRHLFPEGAHGSDKQLALDRVFGSGLFTWVAMGENAASTFDIHSLGEFLLLSPLFALAAYFWPMLATADHRSMNDVWSLTKSEWQLSTFVAFLMVAVCAQPLIEYWLAVRTPNAHFVLRQVVQAFLAVMVASVAIPSQMDRVKLSGGFLIGIGYGMIFYAVHTEWVRREEDKDIEMIGAAQGLSREEVDELKRRHHEHQEDYRSVLLKRVLAEGRLAHAVVDMTKKVDVLEMPRSRHQQQQQKYEADGLAIDPGLPPSEMAAPQLSPAHAGEPDVLELDDDDGEDPYGQRAGAGIHQEPGRKHPFGVPDETVDPWD